MVDSKDWLDNVFFIENKLYENGKQHGGTRVGNSISVHSHSSSHSHSHSHSSHSSHSHSHSSYSSSSSSLLERNTDAADVDDVDPKDRHDSHQFGFMKGFALGLEIGFMQSVVEQSASASAASNTDTNTNTKNTNTTERISKR